jgi:hypothetical protein
MALVIYELSFGGTHMGSAGMLGGSIPKYYVVGGPSHSILGRKSVEQH